MNLSDQAIGAIMMALQKAIMNQEDITEILRGFMLAFDPDENLIVLNPPTIEGPEAQDAED